MFHARRALACLFSAALVTTTAVAVMATPASAETQYKTPSTWAYVDSQAPRTSFVNPAGDAPIGTRTGADGKAHTYRSYFTFDLAGLRGQAIHFSYLLATETAVNDCTKQRQVELWRTGPIRSTITWRNPPAELELLASSTGAYTCPAPLNVSLVEAVDAAIARGQTSLTVELRVPAARERDVSLGRSVTRPNLSLVTNHLPVVSNLGLMYPDRPCGTQARPTPAGDNPTFRATVTDAEGYASGVFSVWPAGHPEQRREFSGSTGWDGLAQASTDLSGFPNGSLVAWAARGNDFQDMSPWSSPCYLRIDRVAPTTAPLVASRLYVEGTTPSGGPGVKGRFWFSAKGDHDVVAYTYTDSSGSVSFPRLVARRPGGPVVIEYTPTRAGEEYLDVTAEDAAGNRGPTTRYRFTVRATAPWGSVDVAGVGLPSRMTLTGPSEVTQFGYQLPGQAEVRVPATNGAGSANVTFPAVGGYDITLRSYVGNRMIGSGNLYVSVDDAPTVSSAEFNLDTTSMAGQTGSFTFAPRHAGVVAYVYSFNYGESRRIEATDGTAVLPWTAEVGGWYTLQVQSVGADGTLSYPATHYFSVVNPYPTAYTSDVNCCPRRDGVGVPLQIELSSELSTAVGFAYRFNGGPEQTVAGQGFAWATVTPDHAGNNTILVQALLSDGTRSPQTEYTFSVWNGPVVTWTPAGNGVVDRPVTFTFHPSLAGVAEYRYLFPGDEEERTVPAGPDGTATATYTPHGWGMDTIRVTSVGGDGTRSETRDLYFFIDDNKVWVSGNLDENSPRSGIGNTTTFSFYTQRSAEVVEYRYHLNDDPEQTIPDNVDGTTTYLAVTLTRNGLNTLYVQSRTAGGELSPVAEYRFLVGTAPLVMSPQYPEGAWGGGLGVAGTFEFSGGTAGIVSFDYSVDGGPATTVAADGAGRAAVTYTPTGDNWNHTMVVTGRKADGTTTDPRSYYFLVQPG